MKKMNLKTILLALIYSLISFSVSAENDTIIIRNDDTTQRIERDLDSLLNNWFIQMSLAAGEEQPSGPPVARLGHGQ